MSDIRFYKGLPKGMQNGVQMNIGKRVVNAHGAFYADMQRPSFSYGSGKSTYASHCSKRPFGTIIV